MEVAHGGKLAYTAAQLTHRGPGISFKDLFRGDDADIPNNYLFTLARQEDFYSPVHHHNFDQFRFVTEGEISILPDMNLRTGDLCYHPEGAYYGPQSDGPGAKEVLVLQYGGASGQGYISHARLKQSQQAMAEHGRFEEGKFHPSNGDAPVDGFQATWEYTMKRSLAYPESRYDRPIRMQPQNFAWKAVEGVSGVSKKNLGVFSERETRAEMFRIASGKYDMPAENATRLLFVWKGRGAVNGEALAEQSAVRLPPGASANLSSDEAMELLAFTIPALKI